VLSGLLTVHDHPPILDKTVDDLQGLHCGSASLVLREPVEPLQHRQNVALSFLYECDCGALS